jgi:hypothetical protein
MRHEWWLLYRGPESWGPVWRPSRTPAVLGWLAVGLVLLMLVAAAALIGG